MAATGGVYLVGSFAALFAPELSSIVDPFYVIALVVEVTFATQLIRGLPHRSTTESNRPIPVDA
jgi:hypothetical protein